MRYYRYSILSVTSIVLIFFLCSLAIGAESLFKTEYKSQKILCLSGRVIDSHHEPVEDVEVKIYLDGILEKKTFTSDEGTFIEEIELNKDKENFSKIDIVIFKASFKKISFTVHKKDLLKKGNVLFFHKEFNLKRKLSPAFWISTLVFVLAYILIGFEILHRTVAALLGAAFMLIISYTIGTINPEYHILTYEAAIKAIDFNVIFLLMGMMIIIGVLKHTGVFQWCAYQSYKLAKGNIYLLTVFLIVFTAVTSSILDNVTTMLLLTGVVIEICSALSINPLAMLMPLIFASNVGGTATLIGDPPNILIGSYAGLTFLEFVKALAPLCVIAIFVLFAYTKLIWGKELSSSNIEDVDAYIKILKKKYKITDRKLLAYGLGILVFVIFLFLTESYWHMEVSIAALFGASVLVTIGTIMDKVDLIEIIETDIVWASLMVFIFLFMLVAAVESTGLLDMVADGILKLSGGSFFAACTFVLWVSAIMSAFVDNIPFTATMLPVVGYLSTKIPGAGETLWWALALGACLGGNGTLIGASANVVTIGIAEAQGYRTTFGKFMKTAFPYMILTIALGEVWLLLVRP